MSVSIAIIADFDSESKAHRATNDALHHSKAALNAAVEFQWVDTAQLAQPDGLKQLSQYTGFWIGPGSPYKNMDGALSSIRLARERRIPLLGTCGGFQHIILEYARHV